MEEKKREVRMKTLYKALEDGYTVRKSTKTPKTFELTRSSPNYPIIDDSKYHSYNSLTTILYCYILQIIIFLILLTFFKS